MGGWPWPLDSVQGWFESFWRTVNEGVSAIGSALASGIGALGAQLSSGISQLQAGLGSLLGQIWSRILEARDVVVGAVQGAIVVFEDALGAVGDAVLNGLRALWDGFAAALGAAAAFIKDRILQPIIDAIQAALQVVADTIKGLASTFLETLQAMAPHSPIGGLEAGIVALGLAAGFEIVAAGASTVLDAVHPFHSLETKLLVFRAFGATGISGIGPAVLGRIFETAILKPMQHELNETYTREIPGAADLVRFVVREQISPEELELWVKRQGFSPKWSQAYWGAHWVPPSREEAVELYHRGVYGLQDVTKWLVINDRLPSTIPDLMALTFRTPSRAELERIVEVADVDEDRLRTWLRADGVSDELLPTYLSLVRGRRLVRILTRAETLVRTEVQAGRLQLDEARRILEEFRFAPEVIDAELRLAKRARELQLREELQNVAVEAFRRALLTKGALVEELQALGLEEDRVGSIVALEEIRRVRLAPRVPATAAG